MGVQNWCHNNYSWGVIEEALLPRDTKNSVIIPAKTTSPSSSSTHGSWLYHVYENGTTPVSEFIQQPPTLTDNFCEPPRGQLQAMVGQHLPVGTLVSKQFVVPAHLALCGDIESNPGPKRERPPTKEQIMQGKVCAKKYIHT